MTKQQQKQLQDQRKQLVTAALIAYSKAMIKTHGQIAQLKLKLGPCEYVVRPDMKSIAGSLLRLTGKCDDELLKDHCKNTKVNVLNGQIHNGWNSPAKESKDSDVLLALKLYGSHLTALDFISDDINKWIESEGTLEELGGIKKAKELYKLIESLQYGVKYCPVDEMQTIGLLPMIDPIIPAAKTHWANNRENGPLVVPQVVDPEPSNEIEKGFEEYLAHKVQMKDGRWRYHFKGGWRNQWITTLCDWDKVVREIYPSSNDFAAAAYKWRDDFRAPQKLHRDEVLKGWFAKSDQARDELRNRLLKLGIKI